MRAIHASGSDDPDHVRIVDIDEPDRGPGEVLIDVHTAGVSYPDVLYARGRYQVRPAAPFVLGQEFAGVVREAPTNSPFTRGDRVAAYADRLGAYAEVATAHESSVFRLPEVVSFEDGAALVVNHLTAHFALRHRGRLGAGETILVHGAAGGVGSAAIQLAKAWDARVIAVASDESKAEVARRAGADDVVGTEDFSDAVRGLTRGRGVNLVLDPVGGERFTDSLRCLAPFGRMLVVGFTSGTIPTVRVNRLLLNNTEVIGVGWGYASHIPGFLQRQWQDLLPLLEDGFYRPLISTSLPLDQTSEALTALEERRALGKVVLRVR
ncbi:NADPH:quinone oxidoreductase family protein [Rhodococcus sp. WS4]|nr:NADPH:quinone oxidoreductase family protein [Rhodococcus sp. WS4]